MAIRICIAGAILALAAGAAAQSLQKELRPVGNGSDPFFTIEKGSTFSATSPARPPSSAAKILPASVITDIQEAFTLIQRNYVSSESSAALARSSINSMLKALDPHSTYYDRNEFAQLMDEQRSEYSGTGSTIADYERGGLIETFILSVFPESAAERAGLRFGDKLVAINGRNVEHAGSENIRELLRGPKGTTVSITLERAGKLFSVSLRRDRVPQRTVTDSFILKEGVGLIRMPDGFSFTSFEEFDLAYSRLRQQGMTSLVLDLRGNPGGILDQSVKIAELFLPEGSLILSQRGRSRSDNRVWHSSNRSPETLPLVVLVNGETASAAEVIAGAWQDNDRAIIVGEKTFGKGLVQSVLDLPSGGGLTLTTARYFTPSGRSLQRDYQHNGAYDYYNHAPGTSVATEATLTRTKRQVYGGDGITPDVQIPQEAVTRERLMLLDPIFYFARELSTGRGSDASSENQSAFRDFAVRGWGVSENVLKRNQGFIDLRLAHDLSLAADGPSSAVRILLSADRQVQTAIRAMPEAVAFASSYYTSRTQRQK